MPFAQNTTRSYLKSRLDGTMQAKLLCATLESRYFYTPASSSSPYENMDFFFPFWQFLLGFSFFIRVQGGLHTVQSADSSPLSRVKRLEVPLTWFLSLCRSLLLTLSTKWASTPNDKWHKAQRASRNPICTQSIVTCDSMLPTLLCFHSHISINWWSGVFTVTVCLPRAQWNNRNYVLFATDVLITTIVA